MPSFDDFHKRYSAAIEPRYRLDLTQAEVKVLTAALRVAHALRIKGPLDSDRQSKLLEKLIDDLVHITPVPTDLGSKRGI